MNERYRYGYGEDFPNRDFPFSRRGAVADRRDEEQPRREADERPERADEEEDTEERQAERIRQAHSADQPRASDPGATMPFQRVGYEREEGTPRPPTPPARDQAAERETAAGEATEGGERGREDIERAREDIGPGREGPGSGGATALPATTGPAATGTGPATAREPADSGGQRPAAPTPRESIFDVGDEPAERPERPAAPQRGPLASGAQEPGRAAVSERPPIALGPPAATPPAQVDSAPAAEAPVQAPADRPDQGEAPAAPSAGPTQEAPPDTPSQAPAAAAVARGGPLQPGEAGGRSSLLASIDRDVIRSRFVDIQAGFVDEPRQAVQEAERFVDELVRRLVQALESERSKLKSAIDDGSSSTEDLRLALRGYRAFVDRLLNLTM